MPTLLKQALKINEGSRTATSLVNPSLNFAGKCFGKPVLTAL
ncbi:MAG: hypothetical protein NW214_03280 [Pseudanabaenaceae cyanobacterium bins.39]|nr:hypothetical protein [Pseudanabaenaceae cyanobacterium bins.39]